MKLKSIVFCLFFISSIGQLLSQKDSNKIKLEISCFGMEYRRVNYIYFNLGINIPARKANYYNSFSFSNNFKNITRDKGLSLSEHTLFFGLGKNYIFSKNYLFSALSLQLGPYYSDFQRSIFGYSSVFSKSYGVGICPRVELGLNLNKISVSVGFMYLAGIGRFNKFEAGLLTRNTNGYILDSSPFLKINFKLK